MRLTYNTAHSFRYAKILQTIVLLPNSPIFYSLQYYLLYGIEHYLLGIKIFQFLENMPYGSTSFFCVKVNLVGHAVGMAQITEYIYQQRVTSSTQTCSTCTCRMNNNMTNVTED